MSPTRDAAMRCATCAALRSDDLILGRCYQMHDNVQALKASAEAGCDLCTLCWTACLRSHTKKGLECLLRGLDSNGDRVDDEKVVGKGTSGLIYLGALLQRCIWTFNSDCFVGSSLVSARINLSVSSTS
ncbi:hypothetical protein F4803DRAFT_405556 [Xylaria telfairii]|nr:hypothetical protein F4803DRAFT_405556 [Xylaria telfairii]